MNTEEIVADLKATQDYIDNLTELADSMEFDDAVAVQDELKRVKSKADLASRMIDGQLMGWLESVKTRAFGNRVFTRVKDYVERFDHDALVQAAISQGMQAGANPDTGEVSPREAAEAAARTMQKLYLSDSSKAKVTVIDQLGIARSDVASKTFKGYKVLVTEIEIGDDEE